MATVRTLKIKSRSGPAKPAGAAINIALAPSKDTPMFYANFFEVARTTHDLTIYGARIPAKLADAEIEIAKDSGKIQLEPEFQIVISPTLAAGLVTALQSQIDKWNKDFGDVKQEGEKNV